LNTLDDIITT